MHNFKPARTMKASISLALAIWALAPGIASAAFYVDEDMPQVTALRPRIEKQEPQPAITEIPFLIGRATLGPLARQTLTNLLPDARASDRVTITAYGSKRRKTLAHLRAAALRSWFAKMGIPVSKLDTIEDIDGDDDNVSVTVTIVKTAQPIFPTPRLMESAPLVRRTVPVAPIDARSGMLETQGQPSAAVQVDNAEVMRTNLAARLVTLWQKKVIKADDAMQLLSTMFKNVVDQDIAQRMQVSVDPKASINLVAQSVRSYENVEQPRTWTLSSEKTLEENVTAWATSTGYRRVDWKVKTPYQVNFTSPINGTFMDALSYVNKIVPALDFTLSKTKAILTVTERE